MSYTRKGVFKVGAFGLGVLAVIGVAVYRPSPAAVKASDHIDSPTVAQDRAADIGDLWAFVDPNDNSHVVLVMSTQNFIVSSEHFGMVIFDHNIRYRFEIENTGDATPDTFVDVRYSPGLGRLTNQTATITLPGGHTFTAPTTIATQEPYATPGPYPPSSTAPPPVVTTDAETGTKFFAGAMDDPFFLDDTGANRLVASAMAHPGHPDKGLFNMRGGRDTYAGFNTLLTVVSVPARLLRGNCDVIGINAVTQRQRLQIVRDDGSVEGRGPWLNIDRAANPLVNNGLIPPPLKNAYNGASTTEDAAGKFRGALIKSMQNFGTNWAYIQKILNVIQVKGDILRLNLRVPNIGPEGGNNPDGGFGHMGGRRFQDDVVDIVFTLLNNGEHLGDDVNGNQVPFRDEIPFAHDPIQPFPKGTGMDDQTQQ